MAKKTITNKNPLPPEYIIVWMDHANQELRAYPESSETLRDIEDGIECCRYVLDKVGHLRQATIFEPDKK